MSFIHFRAHEHFEIMEKAMKYVNMPVNCNVTVYIQGIKSSILIFFHKNKLLIVILEAKKHNSKQVNGRQENWI